MVSWKQADKEMARYGREVLAKLLEHGHEAYWVGGCVRDELMGRPVHDMDITTSARPEEVESLFEKTVPTGIEHGTVTVLCHSYAYEVTTYRVEGAYEKHRRPLEVEFVSELKEDLRRRDFTINAMARAIDGSIMDPYDGQKDLGKGLIRCVGDARTRFQEDALRMVRCIRFASVFGFSIAYRTWRALLAERESIRFVAMERFRVELEKLMEGNKPSRGLGLLYRSKLPAHAKVPFEYEPDRRMIAHIDDIPPSEAVIRWALLLYACGLNAEESHDMLGNWTFPNRVRDQITSILDVGEAVAEMNAGMPYEQQWIKLVLRSGRDAALNWLRLSEFLKNGGTEPYPSEVLENGRAWTEEMEIYHLSELAIAGKDVLELSGRRGGPWVGGILNEMLIKVAARALPNDKKVLIDELKRVISTNE
ncbi:CCA tRNA nucleotidyltransferase [Paenibacillus azoreducens]|uniref:CCA-adding enzyme n=1 Tax=Paenibacillus azoreducens TaxID=116718 RepID=A0A920CUK1_9BACL|nr:CCA tRNA nucleotidyltransferase [Paenibacillus azoreducens]GIO49513.1 CCA-adding enzyme [Paenibacillus azoreducens]